MAFAASTPGPRQLPRDELDPREAFRELTATSARVEEEKAAPASRFETALQRAPAPPEEAASEPVLQRQIPLGGNLVAELPSDRERWSWSTKRGATLILYRGAGGRPEALIYAETFAGAIELRPSAELHRFYATVDPEGDGGSPFLGMFRRALETQGKGAPAAGRPDLVSRATAAQSLATRTLGRGLGFVAKEDTFSGWRWVGGNEHGVSLRLARWEGSWGEQRSASPAPGAARETPMGAARSASSGPLERLPAYLLVGSGAEREELTGAHLAILCARLPECPVAAELAALLTSIRPERDAVRENLLIESLPTSFDDLADAAGLELSNPPAGEG
jgi:hypothetical protein